jgi:hypothetical protein
MSHHKRSALIYSSLSIWQGISVAQTGVVTEPGVFHKGELNTGDAGYAPVSSAHYLKAVNDEGAWVILMFDSGPFTNIDIPALLSQVPLQVRRRASPTSPATVMMPVSSVISLLAIKLGRVVLHCLLQDCRGSQKQSCHVMTRARQTSACCLPLVIRVHGCGQRPFKQTPLL